MAAKRPLSTSQKKALARGRAKLKAMRRRGKTPKRKTVTPKKKQAVRRRNPDQALMRTRTLTSATKAGKKRLTNPLQYVIYNGKRYFDGAGWTVAKSHAAHYNLKKLAALIGQKVADATGEDVYVVSA